ncbi:MAG: FmdB family zinc ribbon protein [Anaerolineae bacterium]
MPIYTYRCDNCGIQFEREQSFSDAPLKICPECRKKSLKKVISPVGVIFKGSGFYSTDHKSSSSGGSHSSAKKDESKPEPKADSKPSKPAEKSES